jgi:acetyltransferase-like isoleucine patch superfamily enzyme
MIRLFFTIKNKMLYPLWRAYARAWRANVDQTVIFVGRPLVRAHRGSTLNFSKRVRIISALGGNPVSGNPQSRFVTMTKNAILDVGEDVGISSSGICAALEIRIGEGTIIGADSLITDTDFHCAINNWRWNNDVASTARPVIIGRGCFIGARSIILKGVRLGDGTIVAAGAVVTKDVPSGFMAIGNPATNIPIKYPWKRDTDGNPLPK